MDKRSHYIDWDKPIQIPCQGGALTVGNFDGVHRGHQALLAELTRQARTVKGPAVALTFDPHPLCLLRPENCPPLLTTVAQRIDLLHRHGADLVLILRTNHAMLNVSAREFFERVLRDQIRPRVMVPGFNFAFGHNREGTVARLAEFCREAHIGFVQVEPAQVGGETISSSRIRAALGAGDVRLAAVLLGRPYTLDGSVVKGQQRGQKLGFPTANLEGIETVLPANGVYAGRARVGEQDWPAALNIGANPTFGEDARKIEAHLIGFDGDLYGQKLGVEFIERLRETRPFGSVQELVAQLQKDVAEARRLASGAAPTASGGCKAPV